MATPQDAIVELDTAKTHIDNAIEMLEGAPPEPPVEENVIAVKAGDNLLALIDAAPEDSTFRLALDYVGDLGTTSIKKPCRLESAALARLPDERVTENLIGPLLKGSIAVTAPDVTFAGLRLLGIGSTVLTAGLSTTVDRCLVLGQENGPQHRGIAANNVDITIRKSHIGRIWKDVDTQAVWCYSGTKNLIIRDCFLEASGENFMSGGADAATADQTPEEILIEDCTFFKPLEWKARKDIGVKNLLELKNAKKVTIRRCTFENNWADAQSGNAILFSVRNQNGRATWTTVEDVLFEDCTLKNVGGGFGILGRDDINVSEVMKRVVIRRVTVSGLSRAHAEESMAAHGRAIMISGGPEDLVFEDCDFTPEPGIITAVIGFDQIKYPAMGLEIRRCKFHQGGYGITGQAPNVGIGLPQLAAHAPDYIWEDVTIYKTPTSRKVPYPPDTEVIVVG